MRSKYLWKFKFFWDDVENAKNDANILKKTYLFGFSLFFVIFGFFKNFIKKMGKKLGSNIGNDCTNCVVVIRHFWNDLYR
jgi:hypothetical protein